MAIYNQILNEYKREYGQRKYRKVNSHISNSNKTTTLIQNSVENNSYPYGEDIVTMVLSHFRYSLASSETVLAASFIVIRELVDYLESNSIKVKTFEIDKLEREIIDECKEIQIR